MSEAVSALNGATYQGFAKVEDAGLRGMITLRGDLKDAKLKLAVKAATGADVPGLRKVNVVGDVSVCWMSPDELLILCDYDDAENILSKLQKPLSAVHHLAVNVSDARANITVTGVNAREVLAKLTPADVAPGVIGPGEMRRTRLAQIPAGFHMPDETCFEVIVFRSVARYAFDLLATAAIPGSEVF